ncbi:MAG: hypothetical protein M0R80_24950 [Proteobacteria bacterium]|nr:hypothetical protein [Pseudomonadota bacterium]
MKKWIVAAGVVAAAVVVVIAVTRPWPKDAGAGAGGAASEEELAQLQALNEKAKAASAKLLEARAKMKPFDPETQRAPYPKPEPTAAEKAAAEAAEHEHDHAHGKRDPADLARHEKANDVVKASELGVREGALKRPDSKPRWDAPAPLDWERLGKLFTGFSIGYKVGGDFTEDVVRELHGAAVEVAGAVLPIDPPEGAMKRFWLVKEDAAEAACLYCAPPAPGIVLYVDASKLPLELSAEDRKRMYADVYPIRVVGRLLLGPKKTDDGIEYLFGLELKEWSREDD